MDEFAWSDVGFDLKVKLSVFPSISGAHHSAAMGCARTGGAWRKNAKFSKDFFPTFFAELCSLV